MNTRRFLQTGVFALAMAFALGACGDDEETTPVPDTPQQTEEPEERPTEEEADKGVQ